MTAGLMQLTPLNIADILKYGRRAHPRREIVSRLVDEPVARLDYDGLARRAARAANALRRLGVRAGDRVSSLAWNTSRHLELFYAVPGQGAVLHTANPRLSDDQIIYTLNHAESAVLLYDRSFQAVVDRIRPYLASARIFVVLADAAPAGALCYETLLSAEPEDFQWPVLDENTGAFLCYTSGTTGDPKGVLYSHRSVVLHAMMGGLATGFGLTPFDVVMPCASLYHATAWGLPFTTMMVGAKLVLSADRMDPATLQGLIAGEGVTFTCGVPTIWSMYLAWLAERGEGTAELKTVVIGGSAVPRDMAEAFKVRHGVQVRQIWGMTETSPLGVVANPTPELMAAGEAVAEETILTRQGATIFGMEAKAVGEDGQELPWDGESSGAIMVRGPCVVRRYFKADKDAVDADGWFDTGDIGTFDQRGYMRLTDRAKDVIKSGGEWISSIDLENAAAGCPGVKVAAVVGVRHPKWEERPILVIETREGEAVTREEILTHMEPRVVKWWLPDLVIFDTVPLTATGKIDKKTLRDRYGDVLL